MGDEPADDDAGFAWFALGHDLHERGGRAKHAETAYRHAIAAGRQDAWLNLGLLLEPLPKRSSDAQTAYRNAMADEDPAIAARAASELGDMLLKRNGDRSGARECFEFALQKPTDEGRSKATLGLAYLLAQDGDRHAAQAMFHSFALDYFTTAGVQLGPRGLSRLADGGAALAGSGRSGPAVRRFQAAMYNLRCARRRLWPSGLKRYIRRLT
jgi:Tfp pilus assembly protein PilF